MKALQTPAASPKGGAEGGKGPKSSTPTPAWVRAPTVSNLQACFGLPGGEKPERVSFRKGGPQREGTDREVLRWRLIGSGLAWGLGPGPLPPATRPRLGGLLTRPPCPRV